MTPKIFWEGAENKSEILPPEGMSESRKQGVLLEIYFLMRLNPKGFIWIDDDFGEASS
jgi:hypothetical protein